jgi:hypothetical protein
MKRTGQPRPRLTTIAACAFAVVAVLVRSGAEARHGITADPDSYMRLAVLQHQVIAGLTTYTFPRDNAPLGMQVHWTLPFDLLALALAAPLAPFLGWHRALTAAAQAAPFASLVILAFALVSLCRALGRPGAAPWAIAIVSASPLIIGYATLGMVNHHVLAVALGLFAIASALRLLRSMRPRQGASASFWAVLAVWESLECDLPVLVATAIVVAASALRRDRGGVRTFCLLAPPLALLVLLLDPPPEGRLALSADRFSLLQVTMFLAIALAPLAARRLRGMRGAIAGSAVLIAWAIFALKFSRPFRPDNAEYAAYFWQSVAELQPAWDAASLAVNAAVPTVFGLAIAAILAWRRPRQHRIWLTVTVLLGFEFSAGIISVRLATHGAALSAVLIGLWLQAYLRPRTPNPQFVLLAFCLAGIVGGTVALAAGLADRGEATCAMGPQTAADLARALPEDAIVAADLWASPEILWRTGLRTIAGPYHRNWAGIEDLAHIFRGTDDATIRPILDRRGAAAIVICATPGNVARPLFAADSLARRLGDGRIPAWLTPIPERQGDNPDIRMFLIAPSSRKPDSSPIGPDAPHRRP